MAQDSDADDLRRRREAAERELERRRGDGDDDLVDTVGDEQRRVEDALEEDEADRA